MKNIQEYIGSGILEAYVFGIAAPEEAKEVEEMANEYEGVRAAIKLIGRDLENYAQDNAIAPDPTIKPFLIATIDYAERMEKGERASFPPLLVESSKISVILSPREVVTSTTSFFFSQYALAETSPIDGTFLVITVPSVGNVCV